jgi:hypothetical protein
MLRREVLLRADVSRELSASFIRVALKKEALLSSETPVLTRATRRNIPEDAILHSHRRENLKSSINMACLPAPISTYRLGSIQSKLYVTQIFGGLSINRWSAVSDCSMLIIARSNNVSSYNEKLYCVAWPPTFCP